MQPEEPTRASRLRPALVPALIALVLTVTVTGASAKPEQGTRDSDHLVGTPQSDFLDGRKGDDRLSGRPGDDRLVGGGGADKIFGGPGFDDIRGGGGGDVISSRDGRPDMIDCGRGEDTALVDSVEDGVLDCEEVVER